MSRGNPHSLKLGAAEAEACVMGTKELLNVLISYILLQKHTDQYKQTSFDFNL